MRPDLRVGVRVMLSAEAVAVGLEHRSKHDRRGRILAARPPVGWLVLWDGRKTPDVYHENFLRAVRPPR